MTVLYLRGLSRGDFQEALTALLGKDAPNLSAVVIGRLKAAGKADDGRWKLAIFRRGITSSGPPATWLDRAHIPVRGKAALMICRFTVPKTLVP